MNQRIVCIAVGVLLTVLIVAGCTAGQSEAQITISASGAGHPAGFLLGFWHGLISPIAFVLSLFSSRFQIYDFYNNGHWYDFGFLLGAAATFGGGGRQLAGTNKK
jgi:hypothetical protein